MTECLGTGTGTGLFLVPGSAWTMHTTEASFMAAVLTGSSVVVPRIGWLRFFRSHIFVAPYARGFADTWPHLNVLVDKG